MAGTLLVQSLQTDKLWLQKVHWRRWKLIGHVGQTAWPGWLQARRRSRLGNGCKKELTALQTAWLRFHMPERSMDGKYDMQDPSYWAPMHAAWLTRLTSEKAWYNYRHTKGLTAGLTDVEHRKYYFYTQLSNNRICYKTDSLQARRTTRAVQKVCTI